MNSRDMCALTRAAQGGRRDGARKQGLIGCPGSRFTSARRRRPDPEPARAATVAVIAVRGLRKEYQGSGGAVVALDDIDFAVSEGEFVAILGPSGCGKSTLLKIVAGLLPGSGGEVRLRDRPVTGPRHDVGMVFQSPV